MTVVMAANWESRERIQSVRQNWWSIKWSYRRMLSKKN